MAQHAALLEQVKALFQDEMAKVHARLDDLEGEVAQLRDRLSPASAKADAPKRTGRPKATPTEPEF